MKRLFFTLIIALVATVGNSWAQCPSLYSGPAEATLRVDGWLSEDLFFDFDDATGTLIVASRGGSGVDAMPDFQAGFNPWFQYVRLEDGTTIVNDNSVGSKVEDESFRDKIKKVIIWCNVTHIGDYAFADCFNLEEVEIQNSVTSIGKGAFMGCEKLSAIVIPNSVKSIGDLAFLHCSSLADVDMGNSVETIGEWAFGYCVITSVTIPNSVTNIGESAFVNCNNLKDVTVSWNTPLSINDGSYIFKGDDIVLHVPTGTTTAYAMANVWKFFGTITDGSTVLVNSLDFSVDGNGVLVAYKGIGGDVTIPNTVKKMQLHKFNDPGNLNIGTLSIPESVIEILGEESFFVFVKEFKVAPTNPNYSSEDGVLYDKNKTVMIKYPYHSENTTYVVPSSVRKFAKTAFYLGGESLEHMVIPSTLEEIEELGIGCAFGVGSFDNTFKTLEVTGNTVPPINLCFTAGAGQCPTLDFKTLIVPAGMKAAYEASSNWNCAGSIVERVETEPGFAQLSVSAASLSLDAGSGSKTFDITSSNVAWTVSSSAAWATVNPASGSGNATVSVSATANTATSPRTATITITGGDITKTVAVTQAKAGDTPAPTLDVSVTSLDFGAESGSKTVNVTSNVAWSVSSTEQWATTSLIYGSGNATITVYALENTTNSSRTATITVTSGSLTKTIKVTQAKAGGSNNNNNDEPATPPTTPTTPITPPQDDPTDIIATPSQPSGNKGEVGLSLNIPSDKSMTGEFTVTMPVGFNLDKSKTTLAQELQSGHSLEISDKATGVWSFQIKSKVSARSASDATYRKIVDIAYTIEDNTAIGNYKIIISDLSFVMEDNTKIEEDDLNVSIPYTSVGNDFMEGAVKVSYYNNTLSVSSPYNERIEVYSITGVQIFNQQKAEGEVKYNIENLPAGIIIVKGSSGWVEKILVR